MARKRKQGKAGHDNRRRFFVVYQMSNCNRFGLNGALQCPGPFEMVTAGASKWKESENVLATSVSEWNVHHGMQSTRWRSQLPLYPEMRLGLSRRRSVVLVEPTGRQCAPRVPLTHSISALRGKTPRCA